MTMTAMDYTELNAQLEQLNTKFAELNKQLEELTAKKEELTIEIQVRREKVVAAFRVHMSQVMDDTRQMIEMGIDPASIDMNEAFPCSDTLTESEHGSDSVVENKEEPVVSSIDTDMESVTGTDTINLESEQAVENNGEESNETCELAEKTDMSEGTFSPEPKGIVPTKKKNGSRLSTPYFYVWGLREGAYRKTCDIPRWKRNAPRLQLPFEVLTSGAINKSLNLGNRNYRDSYPNPDESRIYSANGIAPTLTRVHSNLDIWIGNDPRSREEQSPTPAA